LEDWILYIQLIGYTLEDIVKFWKVGIVALYFWTVVNFCIYTLLFIAFGYRIADIRISDDETALHYRRLSFYFLSYVALQHRHSFEIISFT